MEFDSLGTPSKRVTFRYGNESGSFENYYPNGKVMENGYYTQSKLHGKYKKFYDDGKIMEEGEYQMGKRFGKWYSYDNDGNRIKTKY
jgi:hypothetical protein